MVTAAASSSSMPVQLATFIFDPSLPRSTYARLVQLDGAVHSILRRLAEKHHGENNSIVAPALPYAPNKRKRTPAGGFVPPSAFLSSLPPRKAFAEKQDMNGEYIAWPSFGGGEQPMGTQRGVKRKRREEVGLLEGVIAGLEDTTSAAQASKKGAPPIRFSSLCPAEARPILTALYTPPPTPSSQPDTTPGVTKYLFIFAQESFDLRQREEEWKPALRDTDLGDAAGWEEVASRCRQGDMKVSLVLFGRAGDENESLARKRLKGFIQAVSPGPSTAPWFPLPSRSFAHLSGLSLASSDAASLPVPAAIVGTRPSPAAQASPLQNVGSPSLPNLQPAQAMAMRFLAQRTTAPGGAGAPVPPGLNNSAVSSALANFMTAARNGNIDPNDPQMANFRQMIMLQQQQKLREGQGQGQGKGDGDAAHKAKMMLAMQALQAKQQQQQGAPAPPQQQSAQTVPQAYQPQTAVPAPAPGKNKLWSGHIVWPTQGGGGVARLAVDCISANNGNLSDTSQISAALPAELRIVSSMQADQVFLQTFVREHKVPVLQFELHRDGYTDPGDGKRFESLVNGLSSKGSVGVVHIGSSDRGILLCTAPSGNGGLHKLLGVLCLSVPLPRSPQTAHQADPKAAGPRQTPTLGNTNLALGYAPAQASIQATQASLPSQQGPGAPAMNTMTPSQIRVLVEQAARAGMDLPPNLDPASLTPEQLRSLLTGIKMKNMQKQQLALAQAQAQQQGSGGEGNMSGIDPRLVGQVHAGMDPRLVPGGGGGNQQGLQQMQMQMMSGMSADGSEGQGIGYMGGQYQGGQA